MPAAKGWNVWDIYYFCFASHSFLLSRNSIQILFWGTASPPLSVHVSPAWASAQVNQHISLAWPPSLVQGRARFSPIQVNIGIFFLNYCERGSVFLLGLLSFQKINLELPETTTWSQAVQRRRRRKSISEKSKRKLRKKPSLVGIVVAHRPSCPWAFWLNNPNIFNFLLKPL